MYKTIFFAFVATIGTFLQGYHQAIVAGALLFFAPAYSLSLFQQELIVSTLLLGGCLGAIFGGSLCDLYGRKKALFATAIFLLLGNFILIEANGFIALLIGRLIVGLGIGIATVTVPLYIAEISPAKIRGTLVSKGQLMTTIGILVAYMISFLFAPEKDWRAMFGLGLIPIGLFFFGLFFIPESPLWFKGEILEKNTLKLFHSSIRKPIYIGLLLSIFQQITGINTVIFYAPKILQMVGNPTDEMAIFNTMLIGIAGVFFAIVAFFLIDRAGRRSLLLIGISMMTISLTFLCISLALNASYFALFALFGYVASFSISLGPVVGVMLSEIFPQKIRGRAMGIAFLANWVSNYLVSLTFLSIVHAIGIISTFSLFIIICLIALYFVWKMVPETKGKSFEEIQTFWS